MEKKRNLIRVFLESRKLWQLLSLIIVIFVTPVVMVFGYYYAESIKNNERQEMNNMERMADKSVGEIYKQLNVMNHYCTQIPTNYTLINALNGDGTAYTDKEICSQLKQIFFLNDFAQWLYLYDEKRGEIYSGSSKKY